MPGGIGFDGGDTVRAIDKRDGRRKGPVAIRAYGNSSDDNAIFIKRKGISGRACAVNANAGIINHIAIFERRRVYPRCGKGSAVLVVMMVFPAALMTRGNPNACRSCQRGQPSG